MSQLKSLKTKPTLPDNQCQSMKHIKDEIGEISLLKKSLELQNDQITQIDSQIEEMKNESKSFHEMSTDDQEIFIDLNPKKRIEQYPYINEEISYRLKGEKNFKFANLQTLLKNSTNLPFQYYLNFYHHSKHQFPQFRVALQDIRVIQIKKKQFITIQTSDLDIEISSNHEIYEKICSIKEHYEILKKKNLLDMPENYILLQKNEFSQIQFFTETAQNTITLENSFHYFNLLMKKLSIGKDIHREQVIKIYLEQLEQFLNKQQTLFQPKLINILKEIHNYLENNHIICNSLFKILKNIESSAHTHQYNDQIYKVNKMLDCLLNHNDQELQTNFFSDIFKVVGKDDIKSFLFINQEIFEEIEKHIVFNSKKNFIFFFNIIKSHETFNTQLLDFLKEKVKEFSIQIKNSQFLENLKCLLKTTFNELIKIFQQKIQKEFQNETLIRIDNFLTQKTITQFNLIANYFPSVLSKLFFKEILSYMVEFDIFLFFKKMSKNQQEILESLKTNYNKIQVIFKTYMNPEQLEMFLKPYQLVEDIIVSDQINKIIQSAIKLNLYYKNKIPSKVLQQILIFKNNLKDKQASFIIDHFNNQKSTSNNICLKSYNQGLTINQYLRLKELSLEFKLKQLYLCENDSFILETTKENHLKTEVDLRLQKSSQILLNFKMDILFAQQSVQILYQNFELMKIHLKYVSKITSEDDLTLSINFFDQKLFLTFKNSVEKKIWEFSLLNFIKPFEKVKKYSLISYQFKKDIKIESSHKSNVQVKIQNKKKNAFILHHFYLFRSIMNNQLNHLNFK